mgnify:CR=1 FL=1
MQAIVAVFSHLDPREQNARHDFCEMLFIAFAAMLCGAKNCSDIWRFGQVKKEMLLGVLELPHGIPSHDTFSALLRKLDPAAFAEAFAGFMRRVAAAAGGNRQIAIDGKGFRDLSVGPRNWDFMRHYRLAWPIFDNGLAIVAVHGFVLACMSLAIQVARALPGPQGCDGSHSLSLMASTCQSPASKL